MTLLFSTLTLAAAAAAASSRSVLERGAVGGGNVGTNGVVDVTTLAQLGVLQSLNVGGCRTNLYPGAYIHSGNNWSSPIPEGLAAFMSAAQAHGVTPIILFEYYAPDFNAATGWGSFEEWRGVGAAFAAFLMPGGAWAQAHSAPAGYGVSVYTAVNEPDGGSGFVSGGSPGPAAYANGLAGLSAGVKAVCPACLVLPGGFMSANAHNDMTLQGLATELAPLWANGSLDGIDLHTYYDVQYAPMEGTFSRSAQADFDGIMAAAGLGSLQLPFYSTENNYKLRLVNESVAAAGFLTGAWDQMTVASANNAPLSAQQFPWNLFNTLSQDADYGMSLALQPAWQPALRGCTWGLLAALLRLPASDAWAWESVDPRATGVARLRSPDSLLVVWQNRPFWTTLPPDEFTVSGLPTKTAVLRVYGWEGLRATLPVPAGADSITVKGLRGGETLMFLAQPDGAPAPAKLTGCPGW